MGKFSINKLDGGIGRTAPQLYMVSALILGGVAASGLALNTTSDKLKRIEDLEALGIDASYDTTNNVLVYHHVSEFFRINPNGELYIRLVAQGTSMTTMCDKTNTHLKTLLADTNGEVRQVGVVLNPLTTYTSTLSGGLDADVGTAIAKAQELAEEEFGLKRPVQILIEGREFNGTVASATDLRTSSSENVHVTILQDLDVADNHAIHADYAAVGTTLGAMSLAKVSENIGWTGKFNLQDTRNGAFVKPGLSNNASISSYEADFDTLTTKGYLFGRNYPGQAGVFFDSFPTCTALTSDYAYGENQRTIQEAIRLVYNALFPRVNSPIQIDPDTGQIDNAVAKAFEADANKALAVLAQSGDVSGFDSYVDPTQDVQSTGKIKVDIKVVPISTARELTVSIGFTKKL